MFMTERGDPRAIYDVSYSCNTAGELQTELVFKARDTDPGGNICVRLAAGDRYEFRYSPPGNTGMFDFIILGYRSEGILS
jgi:hypothetical protein